MRDARPLVCTTAARAYQLLHSIDRRRRDADCDLRTVELRTVEPAAIDDINIA